MKFFLWFSSLLMTLAVVGAVALAWWGMREYRAPGPLGHEATFVVARGQGVADIARGLEAEGMIGNALIFRGAARITGADKTIHAGEYIVPASASVETILERMAKGQVVQRSVTVREGLTSWQVMNILGEAEGLEGEVAVPPDEGTLLPETYNFLLADTRDAMVARMQEAMDKTLAELWPGRSENLPVMSEREAVTLASIVEKETGVAAERARIAGVFVNRLRLGMPLQSDPTVIYAMTGGMLKDEGQGPIGRRLLRADLQFESPYNTYKYPGLPPGPIANPGRAAIEAVLHPEAHEYLYFVADGTGGHVFAKTLDEHNANAAKWREARKKAGN